MKHTIFSCAILIALIVSPFSFANASKPTVRVGMIDGEIILNPTNSQRDVSDLDLVVVGTEDAVAMVEAGANQLQEDVILNAIFRAHEEIQKIIKAQHELFRDGNREKPSWTAPEVYPESLPRPASWFSTMTSATAASRPKVS